MVIHKSAVLYGAITAAEQNARLYVDTLHEKIVICTANASCHVFNNNVKHLVHA